MATKTTDQIEEDFLRSIGTLITQCEKAEHETTREKLFCLAHGILAMIDGVSGGMPAFILAPREAADARLEAEMDQLDHYPNNDNCNVISDISGMLHDHLPKYVRR